MYNILLFSYFKKAFLNLIKNDGFEHAGYLSFMILLSIFPFLLFIITIVGNLLSAIGTKTTVNVIISQFLGNTLEYVPEYVEHILKPSIDNIIEGPDNITIALIIISITWTSSSMVEALRTILNKVYCIYSPPPYIMRRLLSILQFFIIIFVISVFLIFYSMFSFAFEYLKIIITNSEIIPIFEYCIDIFYYPIIVIVLTTGISSIYIMLPNKTITLKEVLPGAVLVIVLWIIALKITMYYIIQSPQVNVIYGSLTSIIAAMLMFYVISICFIYGAEFNNVLLKKK